MFSKRFLETLLALDYIFACGSAQDRMDGLNLLEQVVRNIMLAGIDSPEWSARAAELEIPAVVEIAIPIANEFPDDVPEKLVRFLPCMFPGKETAAACIYTYKWTLRVKAFAKWDATIDLNQVLASNVLVTHGLLHYTIYWHHLQKNARPDADSNGQAVQALFDEIYGKQAAAKEHKKYLALLNAAYPPEAKASTPQSSNFE